MNATPHALMWAEFLALLIKQPRTVPELMELTGSGHQNVASRIEALHGEGLVYRSGWRKPNRGRIAAVWSWQPSVCAHEDVPAPAA